MAAKKQITPLGLRIDTDLVREFRLFAQEHPYKPSLTHLIEMSMREFLARHRADNKPDKPHRR